MIATKKVCTVPPIGEVVHTFLHKMTCLWLTHLLRCVMLQMWVCDGESH